MAGYGEFKAAVISKCTYTSEGVGYSTVMEDFPLVLGPLAIYDQIDILMKPWGRHPVTNLPLFVNESNVNRWTGQVTTDGVVSTSAYATPTKDTLPPACIVIVTVSSDQVLYDIDGHAKHFVLGIWNPDLNGDALQAPLDNFDIDEPFPSARWTSLRNKLVTIGMDAETIDNWKTNNPNATPTDFSKAFKNFIQ